MKYFVILGALVLAVACGSKKEPGTFVGGGGNGGTFSTTGGSAGRSGHSGSTGVSGNAGEPGEAGAAGAAGAADDAPPPTVVITSPTPVVDPGTGNVLTGDAVTVTCSVTASKTSGIAVLGSSVTIQMIGADGKQIGSDGSVLSTTNANEYSARFVLTGVVPSGQISFTCSASDQSATPHTGTATVQTFYDAGPTIALSNPTDKSAHSLSSILFEFSALPAPLVTGDKGAAVDKVTLSVNGVAITAITELTNTPGYYQSDINLNDPKTFSPQPVGSVPIAITATNQRGTTATQNYTFVVDSTGPTITIVSPPTTSVQFVGGQTTIQFTVADEDGGSGVNPGSVQVTVNTSAPVTYVEGNYWHHASGTNDFAYSFNTLDYPSQLGVTIAITAFDNAGNMAQGASAFYYLDNVPPIVDMQTGPLQEEHESGSVENCSEFFDPLGDSPKDTTTVPSVNTFRSLVWDLGNLVDGQGISFFSDVDTQVGVRLYFQQDTTKPLLKNFSGIAGGVCDEIADTTLPFITLTPVTPAGSSYFDVNAPLADDCVPGSATTPPDRLCNKNSTLTRVIQHATASAGTSVPVIYAFQPDDGPLCTGGQFDLTTKITKDGWICASVVAQDRIGNRAVSPPMRFCLDAADQAGAGYVGTPSCTTGAAPPTCVAPQPAGCVPPPHFGRTLIVQPD